MFTLFNGGVHVYIKSAFTIIAFVFLGTRISKIKNASLLLAFCIVNAFLSFLFKVSGSYVELFTFLLSPVVFFLYGYTIVKKSKTEDEIILFILITILSSSILLWSAMFSDAAKEGIINATRHVYNEEYLIEHSATLLGLMASIGISAIAYVIMYGFRKPFISILFLASAFLSMFVVLHLVNRTGIIVLAITAISTILYSTKGNRGSFLVVLLLLVAIYFFFTQADTFSVELYDAYDARSASAENGGIRIERWKQSLMNIVSYPMGWRRLSIMGYSHNLWLDVAASVGIIPFILLIWYSIKSYKNTYLLYKTKGIPFNGFLIGVNVCFFVSALVEPIIEALSTYFYLMCLIWGIQQAHIESLSSKK